MSAVHVAQVIFAVLGICAWLWLLTSSDSRALAARRAMTPKDPRLERVDRLLRHWDASIEALQPSMATFMDSPRAGAGLAAFMSARDELREALKD